MSRNPSRPIDGEGTQKRLRPAELIVDPENPFLHDKLGREPRVRTLCERIIAESEAAVVAVNGGFGSGKSVFLKMCAAHLRRQGVTVVEFNAWQQSHTDTPLVDLVAAVTDSCLNGNRKLSKRIRKLAVKLAKTTKRAGIALFWSRLSKHTLGLLKREDFEESGKPLLLSEWKEIEKCREEFREALTEAVAGAEDTRKIVVCIDELDRCLPMKALTILDVVRHLFDVPGVVVVIGVNREELGHRVKTIYGEKCDASTYLRRFVDLPITLNNPKSTRLEEFLGKAFDNARIPRRADAPDEKIRMLGWLIELQAMSLRDIEQLLHRITRVFNTLRLPDSPIMSSDTASGHTSEDRLLAWELAVLVMAVLRSTDQNAYEKLIAGGRKGFYTAAEMIQAFSINGQQINAQQVMSSLIAADYHVTGFLVPYLYNHLGVGPDSGSEDVLKERFIREGLGSETLVQDILRQWSRVEHVYGSERFSVQALSDLIELVG